MVCGDKNIQQCVTILSTWLADHMKNVNIHFIKVNQCLMYVASRNQLVILPKPPNSDHDDMAYEHLVGASVIDWYVMQ